MITLELPPPTRAIECDKLLRLCLEKNVVGDVMELGVSKGDTTSVLARTLKEIAPQRRYYACDTFGGLPYNEDLLQQGEWASTKEQFLENIGSAENVVPVVGTIEETLPRLAGRRKFCFAFLDLDLYKSTVFGTRWLIPNLSIGAIIGYHDYKFERTPGIERAIREEILSRPDFQRVDIGRVNDNLAFYKKVLE